MIRILTAAVFLISAATAFAGDAPTPMPIPTTPAKPFVYAPKPSDVVIGKKTAPVVIVEYASLSCPHCAHFYTQVLPELTKRYIDTGKAQLVYRDYPLNQPAMEAAKLVQCAGRDRRHAFLKVLFTTQNKWALDPSYTQALANIAALGGIDHTAFEACMGNKALESTIYEVAKEAQNDYKVNSTPTFFINNKLKEGDHDVESMSKAIDSALAKSTKK